MTVVLIAEDDPDIAGLLSEGIGDHLGAETAVVMNGALVPDEIASRNPDLIILDVSLPGLSGLDIFDLVRNEPQWRAVPVLFLTASPEKAEAAFAPTGRHRVMSKPFDVDALLATVRAMLAEPRATEAAA